ncbi:Pyridoxal-dependent decarboxylase conserved domain [Ceratobasidium sp. AG-Ba]|nr:Pyridoxal-dependent decarboxylase conserved domain [Ceratobasidium sp. AG-Ba]QRW10777.1 Pyridoxal-dependent decarboxylase conserved domain [Ceratobasidium sp. AG-Ba]
MSSTKDVSAYCRYGWLHTRVIQITLMISFVAVTDIGSDNIINIPVDNYARMDATALDGLLKECLDNKRAIYVVVSIMGSTDHGAVDPLADVVILREKYQRLGLSFALHADCAWGGYFASTLHEEIVTAPAWVPVDSSNLYAPEQALGKHTRK